MKKKRKKSRNSQPGMMKKIFLRPIVLIIVNIAIFAIILSSVNSMMEYMLNLTEDIDRFDELSDALSAILVAYGIILEERIILMKMGKLYPAFKNREQTEYDELCERFGPIFLIAGCINEISTEILRIPHRFFNMSLETQEMNFFILNNLIFAISAIALIIFTIRLIKIWRENPSH